jgi:3-hydroxybutyryl-CoA dehydrogenase
MNVAIIGAGPLGRSLALRAARAGFRVFLEDVMPANLHHARESIRLELSSQTLPSVVFVSTIEDAVRTADLVIDCVPDELESKLEILWLVDRMAPPRTIIATPTLSMSIVDLAGCTNRPEQCLAIAASAEDLAGAARELLLRTALATNDESIALVSDFFRQLGFSPSVERSPA